MTRCDLEYVYVPQRIHAVLYLTDKSSLNKIKLAPKVAPKRSDSNRFDLNYR